MGGYTDESRDKDSAQFDISDHRTLDEIVSWLLDSGHVPSFCTACYREGRTGDHFMALVKNGKIADCCGPNALLTLKEYLEDYASPEVKAKGQKAIEQGIAYINSEKVRGITRRRLDEIEQGKRDFRF